MFTDDMSFISEHGAKLSASDHYFIYNYPKSENITEPQKTYIQNYMRDFEDALAGPDFADENLGYRAYIDVDSFVDYFIATEISGNVDGYRLSTFLVKNKNEKLAMGPLWDYNLALGNADYNDGARYDYWLHRGEENFPGSPFAIPFWWYRLLEDDYFVSLVKLRWENLRVGELSNVALTEKITALVLSITSAGAVDRNFSRWNILGTYIWPNDYIGDTHDQEVTYLREWLMNRMLWLDTEIDTL